MKLKGLADDVGINLLNHQDDEDAEHKRRTVTLGPPKANDPAWLKRGATSWMYRAPVQNVLNSQQQQTADSRSVPPATKDDADERVRLLVEAIEETEREIEQQAEYRRTVMPEEQHKALRVAEERLRAYNEEVKEILLAQHRKRQEYIQARVDEQREREQQELELRKQAEAKAKEEAKAAKKKSPGKKAKK